VIVVCSAAGKQKSGEGVRTSRKCKWDGESLPVRKKYIDNTMGIYSLDKLEVDEVYSRTYFIYSLINACQKRN
jgi:hypothetical protein